MLHQAASNVSWMERALDLQDSSQIPNQDVLQLARLVSILARWYTHFPGLPPPLCMCILTHVHAIACTISSGSNSLMTSYFYFI